MSLTLVVAWTTKERRVDASEDATVSSASVSARGAGAVGRSDGIVTMGTWMVLGEAEAELMGANALEEAVAGTAIVLRASDEVTVKVADRAYTAGCNTNEGSAEFKSA